MRILCFGEPLVRLATEAHARLEEATTLEISYAGAEFVVAVALAHQGEDVSYVTKLSSGSLGTNALMTLAGHGVNTSRVIRSESRMGVYYVERGKSIRPTIVTYDRTGTALANATHEDFDWDHILNGIEMVFFSGIIPAISDEMALACTECLRECKGRGIRTVFDLNYRSTLWSARRAREVIEGFMPMVDVLTASEDDILQINEAEVTQSDVFGYCLDWAGRTTMERGCESVSFISRSMDRFDVATFRGCLVEHGITYFSREQSLAISDLSGCGGHFTAGIVHAKASRWEPQFSIDYATMSSAFKATVRGELSYANETEIARLLANTVSPSILQ